MELLDFIFPKICVNCGQLGSYLCSPCREKIEKVEIQICPVCTKPSISGLTHPRCQTKLSLDGLYSFVFFSPPLPQALYKLKYKFVKDFSNILVNNLRLDLPQLFKAYYITPIPLHKFKNNWRGFNQVEILAEMLAGRFKLNYKSSVLIRKKPTKSQVGLSKQERAENVKSAFEIMDKAFAKDKQFLLFDDVWTSGATLRNAGAVLKRSGAKKVWGLTLARSR